MVWLVLYLDGVDTPHAVCSFVFLVYLLHSIYIITNGKTVINARVNAINRSTGLSSFIVSYHLFTSYYKL